MRWHNSSKGNRQKKVLEVRKMLRKANWNVIKQKFSDIQGRRKHKVGVDPTQSGSETASKACVSVLLRLPVCLSDCLSVPLSAAPPSANAWVLSTKWHAASVYVAVVVAAVDQDVLLCLSSCYFYEHTHTHTHQPRRTTTTDAWPHEKSINTQNY